LNGGDEIGCWKVFIQSAQNNSCLDETARAARKFFWRKNFAAFRLSRAVKMICFRERMIARGHCVAGLPNDGEAAFGSLLDAIQPKVIVSPIRIFPANRRAIQIANGLSKEKFP